MHTIKGFVAIAVLSFAPVLASAGPKAAEPSGNQQPSVVPGEMAPIQPLYQTVLPPAFTDDAMGG